MKPNVLRIGLAVVLALASGAARADNRALILANEDYRFAPDIGAAEDAERANAPLQAAGFAVVSGRDLTTDKMRQALGRVLANREAAERTVIIMVGHFVKSERGTWFLGTDARRPDLSNVDGQGLSLATVLEVAAATPGGALVLLGDDSGKVDLGAGLTQGIGAVDIPQGVTLVAGDVASVTTFAEKRLPLPGKSLASLLAAHPNLRAEGYLSDLTPFMPARAATPAPKPTPTPAPGDATAERTFWLVTRSIGTIEAYENFLKRFPDGTFSAMAQAEIDRLQPVDPLKVAEAEEDALRLTRDQRRSIQRDLTLMGFDTRGIDGVFGRGSRAAISRWQGANGEIVTGFVNRPQIRVLATQAQRRAAELEAEAAARQAEEERRDRLYWSQTGALGDEAGLRVYLKKYPDGVFSELAKDRLEAIEEARRQATVGQDRAAWDAATRLNSIASYSGYLDDFPRGAFAAEAAARVADLEEEARAAAGEATAKAIEDQLNLPAVARNLVEVRLDQLGLKPGVVDGRFDDDTRKAIRKFQRSRGIPVTGYLTQEAVVQLLSGGVLKFGD